MSFFPAPLSHRNAIALTVGLFLMLGLMGSYFLIGWSRGMDTSLLVMYRPAGDIDAYPAARQFGGFQFGEGYTSGKIGKGWIEFPCASMLPHGIFLHALGPLGFVLVDIITPCVYFALLARLLMCAGVIPSIALSFALFGSLQGFTALSKLLIAVFGYSLHSVPFYLDFIQSWGLRFPRQFVSDLYVLGALSCWLQFSRSGNLTQTSVWIGSALWMGAVAQSDIYSFSALSIAFTGLGLVFVLTGSAKIDRGLWWRVGLALGIFALIGLPFLLQRWHADPSIAARYGAFVLARRSAVELATRARHFFPLSFILGSLALPWLAWLVGRWQRQSELISLRGATALSLLQLAGYVALPCFVAVAGQAIQLYHFRDAAHGLVGLSALISLALIVSAFSKANWSIAWKGNPGVPVVILGVALLIVSWLIVSVRGNALDHLNHPGMPLTVGNDTIPPWSQNYRDDFVALAHQLDQVNYAGANVLATADRVVYSWWCGLRGGQSFLAHSVASALSEREMLLRLVAFARLNQLAPEQFISWLTTETNNLPYTVWLSNNLYGANLLHAYSPLSDYTAEQRQKITTIADPLECWYLALPQSELRRFAEIFAETAPKPIAPLPDLLLLTHEFEELRPDPRLFTLAYENRTFRLYRLHSDLKNLR